MALFKNHFHRTAGGIAFRERTRRLGIYPICYRPAQTGGEAPHVHDFLELFLVLSGRAVHQVGKNAFPVTSGDIVFTDSAVPHFFREYSGDFEVLNLCFLPSALGYSDALLRDPTTLDYYALLVPFQSGESEPLRLHPEARAFRKIAFHAFHLMERFFQPGGAPLPGLGDSLRLFLGLVVEEAGTVRPAKGDSAPFKQVLDLLRVRYREKLSLADLASAFRMSPGAFSSRFNRVTGGTLHQFINALRCHEAERLLRETRLPANRIALEVGYENVPHFTTVFKRHRGKTPLEVRRSAASRRDG